MIEALTQRALTPEELAAVTGTVTGGAGPVAAEPLTGGEYNAAYLLRLPDGDRAVLKVAPPPEVRVLRYERGLMATEIDFLRRAATTGVPVPRLRHADTSRTVIDRDFLVVDLVPGVSGTTTWGDDAASARLHRQCGGILARLHTVTGPVFGYDRPGASGRAATWRQAFLGMVDDVLTDGRELRAELPAPPDVIGDVVRSRAGVLDGVDRPALLHFDLWAGNVLVDPGTTEVNGVIDGERSMFGDPAADFVGMCVFDHVEDRPEVLAGYAAVSGTPLRITDRVRARMSLYRIYLFLIMAIEGYSRGTVGTEREPVRRRALDLLEAELSRGR